MQKKQFELLDLALFSLLIFGLNRDVCRGYTKDFQIMWISMIVFSLHVQILHSPPLGLKNESQVGDTCHLICHNNKTDSFRWLTMALMEGNVLKGFNDNVMTNPFSINLQPLWIHHQKVKRKIRKTPIRPWQFKN